MADLDKIMTALRNAHAAGDTAAAQRLAQMARAARDETAAQTPEQMRREAMLSNIAAAQTGTLSPSDASMSGVSNADQQALDRMTLSAIPPAISGLTKFSQGLPFVGEYSDELTGLIGRGAEAIGLVSQGTGARAEEMQRNVQGAMERQYPKTSAALQIGGGVVGSIPLAAAALPSVAARLPASLAGRAVVGALAGATAGGVEGAVSGYGAGTGDNRANEAIKRGLLGATFGGLVGGAAPVVGAGVRNALARFKGSDVSTISNALNISADAARVVKSHLQADDLSGAANALRRAGPDAMIADVTPGSAQLLDTVMSEGGQALQIGRTAVDARARNASAKLASTLDGVLGVPEGIKAATKSIAVRTAPAREKAYQAAYNTAINYADDAGRAIEAVLQRVPVNTIKGAIQEANDAMRAAGVRNQQIMAEIADDGSVVFREMPNVQQLDELKKALGQIARNETDALTGKITAAGARAKGLAADLANAISDAVPSYRSAVRLGGDKIAEQNALELGMKLLSPQTTRETVSDIMNGASVMARDAIKRGLRSRIDETLANVRTAIADFDPTNTASIKEAMRMVSDMSSRANRQKVEMAIGKAQADRLFSALSETAAQLTTRMATARGSATAVRQAGKQTIDDLVTGTGVIRQITSEGSQAQGAPVKAMVTQLVRALTGSTGEAAMKQRQAIYADIARALTEKRGPDADVALNLIQSAMAKQSLTTAEIEALTGAVTKALGVTAYQAPMRSLPTSQRAPMPQ